MSLPIRVLLGGSLLVPCISLASSTTKRGPEAATATAANRYIGAKACKNCHAAEEAGNQYHAWETAEHAKAFATLASEAAKKVAEQRGIKDPQKSAECLQCHATAHGEPKRMIKTGFKEDMGVQCESCHGPGETHFTARMAAAAAGKVDPKVHTPVPEGELLAIAEETCRKCHNEKSPTYKPFCFKQRRAKILHLDPRRTRTKEQLEALQGPCDDTCKVCAASKKEGEKKDAEKKDAEKKDAEKKDAGKDAETKDAGKGSDK